MSAAKRYRTSAGLLLYRGEGEDLEFFIAHPGGPFFRKKDAGHWTVVKGEYDPASEDPWDAARREFVEETGFSVPPGTPIDLGEITQKGGKRVRCFALAGEVDPAALRSNTFALQWPPKSGITQRFPEVDRADYFPLDAAKEKLKPTQWPLLDRLVERLAE